MTETYIVRLPNRPGVFMKVCDIIAKHGGNLVRINYNKGIDMNTVFLEVEGEKSDLDIIREHLEREHYLARRDEQMQVILVELRLPDGVGTAMPVLRAISDLNVNISFINYQHVQETVQTVRMGLFIDRPSVPRQLVKALEGVCEVKILNYEVTDRSMDGSVFYATFAKEMQKILDLDDARTEQILIQSNRIMQMLDEDNKAYLKTFDFIRRFAQFIQDHKKENFRVRISRLSPAGGLNLTVIEPPCGGNTFVLEYEKKLLFVDCGFACYRDEMLSLFYEIWPDFDRRSKEIMITHADIDHTGILDLFDKVYLSESCYENFIDEKRNVPNFREQNVLHQPYCIISKIITGYRPPSLENCVILGRRTGQGLLRRIGQISFGKWVWLADEGMGGHVRGETVISCPQLGLVFAGDIFVNIREFSEDQREFNLLAPYLMTSVEEDSALARQTRNYFLEKFAGYLICPGHGPVKYN